MISEDFEWILCEKQDCPNKIKNHKWGQVKADGWFFTKSGEAWCPKHRPTWFAKWDKKRQSSQ